MQLDGHYIFFRGLLYDSVIVEGYVASNGSVTGELWIAKDLVGSGCDLIYLLSQNFHVETEIKNLKTSSQHTGQDNLYGGLYLNHEPA